MSEAIEDTNVQHILDHMRSYIVQIVGEDQVNGFQILWLVRLLSNLSSNLHTQRFGDEEISGPRVGLMVRLLMEEHQGNTEGVTPSDLSSKQRVSRNTISALLRGLEEQGLIERHLDPLDRRLFRIRLSDEGRALVKTLGPLRIAMANEMVSALSKEEQEQLILLLTKLINSLKMQCPFPTGKADFGGHRAE